MPRRTLRQRQHHLEEIGRILYAEFRKWRTSDILERMVAEDVPVGPVLGLEDLLDDPQIRHNGRVFEREHPSAGVLRQCKPAARFSATPQEPASLPPLLGEHTDELLEGLGYDEAARRALRADGVVF